MLVGSGSVYDQLLNFIQHAKASPLCRVSWLEDDAMRVYIRSGTHLLGGNPVRCLDVASVMVFKKNRGTFSNYFLPLCLAQNPFDALFVESVHNQRLKTHLLNNGFTMCEIDPSSVYLLKENYRVYQPPQKQAAAKPRKGH